MALVPLSDLTPDSVGPLYSTLPSTFLSLCRPTWCILNPNPHKILDIFISAFHLSLRHLPPPHASLGSHSWLPVYISSSGIPSLLLSCFEPSICNTSYIHLVPTYLHSSYAVTTSQGKASTQPHSSRPPWLPLFPSLHKAGCSTHVSEPFLLHERVPPTDAGNPSPRSYSSETLH